MKTSYIQHENKIQHFPTIFHYKLGPDHTKSIGSATLPPVSNSIFSLPPALSTLPVWCSSDIPRAISNPVIALSGMPGSDGCPLVCARLRSSGRDSAALPRSSRVTSLRHFSHHCCRTDSISHKAMIILASFVQTFNPSAPSGSWLLAPWQVFTCAVS